MENNKSLIHHLLGETRTAILATLLLRPEESRHLRDLERTTGLSPGARRSTCRHLFSNRWRRAT